MSVAAVFFLQTSWFVAWLTVDQRRVGQRRNGLIPCIVHEDKKPRQRAVSSTGQCVEGGFKLIAPLFEYRIFQARLSEALK